MRLHGSSNEEFREAVHKAALLGLLRQPDQTLDLGTTADWSSDQMILLSGRKGCGTVPWGAWHNF